MVRPLVLGFAVALTVAGCKSAPIRDIEHVYFDDAAADLAAATDVILSAGSDLGWSMALVESGRVEGVLRVRSHTAVVEIPFDEEKYSIRYARSANLNYDAEDRTIHKNYNLWVRSLNKQIRARAKTLQFGNVLDSWVGHSIGELVQVWGPPDKQFTLDDGTAVLEYGHDAATGGGSSTTLNTYHDLYLGSLSQRLRTQTEGIARTWCQASFTVTPDRVVGDWSWRGNDCEGYYSLAATSESPITLPASRAHQHRYP